MPASQVITPPTKFDKLFALRTEDTSKPRMYALEQFRVLRSRLLETMRTANMCTLLVTSPVAEEGKTVTSINLAFALSRVEGLRILLVDADLRKPTIASMLGIPVERGLLDYLKSGVPLSEIIMHLSSNLAFIPSMDQRRVRRSCYIRPRCTNCCGMLARCTISLFSMRRRFSRLPTHEFYPALCGTERRSVSGLKAPQDSTVRDAVALVSKKVVGTVLVGTRNQSHNHHYYYKGA